MAARSRGLGRLALAQGIFACALSVAAGSITAVQLCFGLRKFGGLQYAARVAILSGVRELGPTVSATSAFFALVVWTHESAAESIRAQLSRAALQTLLMAAFGAALTTALTIASSMFVIHAVCEVPWATVTSARNALSLDDIPAAIRSFLESALLDGAFCWFALPAMARRSWSIAHKFAAIFGTALLLRLVFAFA